MHDQENITVENLITINSNMIIML